MSTHPNAMLILRLEPDDVPCKTLREMLDERRKGFDRDGDGLIRVNEHDSNYPQLPCDTEFAIGDIVYRSKLMDGYDESDQIDGEEGQIVLYDLMTYGFGESIAFDEVKRRAEALEAWAAENCPKHKISKWSVEISANYW